MQTAARAAADAQSNETEWRIDNPRGSHAIAVGLDGPIAVTVGGSTGYYCAGMNKEASITVEGSAGPGVAENMMSGTVVIEGDASQYAGATGRGGLLVVKGNAASRCGISMKGIDIVVHGNIGHMSAFMAQSGTLVVCGDAGDALGTRSTKPACSCAVRSRASARIASKRKCGLNIWNCSPTCSNAPVPTPVPRSSGATVRPGSSTPSTSITPRRTERRHRP